MPRNNNVEKLLFRNDCSACAGVLFFFVPDYSPNSFAIVQVFLWTESAAEGIIVA